MEVCGARPANTRRGPLGHMETSVGVRSEVPKMVQLSEVGLRRVSNLDTGVLGVGFVNILADGAPRRAAVGIDDQLRFGVFRICSGKDIQADDEEP